MAASATLALNAGACVRRTRLVMVAPDLRHPRRSQAEIPLIDLSEFGQPPLCSRHAYASRCRISVSVTISVIGSAPPDFIVRHSRALGLRSDDFEPQLLADERGGALQAS